jgi:hypothetical protein
MTDWPHYHDYQDDYARLGIVVLASIRAAWKT